MKTRTRTIRQHIASGMNVLDLFLHRQPQCGKAKHIIPPRPRYNTANVVGPNSSFFFKIAKSIDSQTHRTSDKQRKGFAANYVSGSSKSDYVFNRKGNSATERTSIADSQSSELNNYLTASDHDVTQKTGQRQPFSLASRFCCCWHRSPRISRLRHRR